MAAIPSQTTHRCDFCNKAVTPEFVSSATIDPATSEQEITSVAEWLRAWDSLTMFEATVCGRS